MHRIRVAGLASTVFMFAAVIGARPADPNPYSFVTDTAHQIRYWYLATNGPDQANRLMRETNEAGVYEKAKHAMNGHTPCVWANAADDANQGVLNVYLVVQGAPTPTVLDAVGGDFVKQEAYGLADSVTTEGATPGCEGSAAIVLLDASQLDRQLAVSFAHELFHAFQDSFKGAQSYAWLMEATAKWFEDVAYPTTNSEWGALQTPDNHWNNRAMRGGSKTTGPLDADPGSPKSAYSSYLFFFFLTQHEGYDNSIVGTIFGGLADKGALDVIRAAVPWEDTFKRFTLTNWNDTPVDLYDDHGSPLVGFAEDPHPEVVSPKTPATFTIDLHHSQAIYERPLMVSDPDAPPDRQHIRQLDVDLSDIRKNAQAEVQAIVTLVSPNNPKGEPHVEDWTGIGEKHFCLAIDSENVKDLVLIVGDTSIDPSDELKATITVKGDQPCKTDPGNYVYHGSARLDFDDAHGTSMSFETSYAISSKWTLAFDHRDDVDGTKAYYTIDAESTYAVSGEGHFSQNVGNSVAFSRDTASESNGANGISHNPARPGEPQYREDEAEGAGSLHGKGRLVVWTDANGVGHYQGGVMLSGVMSDDHFREQGTSSCSDSSKPPLSTFDSVDSASGERLTRRDGCDVSDSNRTKDDALSLDGDPFVDRKQRVFTGTFDPKTGVIAASDSDNTTNCSDAVGMAPSLEQLVVRAQMTRSGCNGRYSVSLQIRLPSEK